MLTLTAVQYLGLKGIEWQVLDEEPMTRSA
jgi:hypothetical protein